MNKETVTAAGEPTTATEGKDRAAVTWTPRWAETYRPQPVHTGPAIYRGPFILTIRGSVTRTTEETAK